MIVMAEELKLTGIHFGLVNTAHCELSGQVRKHFARAGAFSNFLARADFWSFEKKVGHFKVFENAVPDPTTIMIPCLHDCISLSCFALIESPLLTISIGSSKYSNENFED